MRFFGKYLSNNQGATSVLIMVMMIILMIFGLAALTTSAASRKLAQKNADWLTDYYKLHGQAEVAYAHLTEALDLKKAGLDTERIETALIRFLKENANCSFQKNAEPDKPFRIEMKITEEGKEVPKNIQMEFLLVRSGDFYELKTQKWSQYQAEIFDSEDEIRFSDIRME